MAKKKKSRKRQRQNPQPRPAAAATAAPAAEAAVVSPPVAPKAVSAPQPSSRWSYVGYDIRRIGILFSLCVALELILWAFFEHTALGPAVYDLIKL